MRANLYVRYKDLEKYMSGEEIKAAPSESKSVLFRHEELLSVSVDVSEIISREEVTERGFVNGTFTRYAIQKEVLT